MQLSKNLMPCPLKSSSSSILIWWQHLNGFKLCLIFVPELNKTCTHLWPLVIMPTPLLNYCNRVFINLSVRMDVISRQLDRRRWYMNHQANRSAPKYLAFVPAGRRGRGAATNLGQMKHMSLFSSSSSSF